MNEAATKVIDALGGTAAVARIFDVAMPSVSDWKRSGIPRPRVMFLRLARRKALAGIDLEAATAPRRTANSSRATSQQPLTQEVA